ncbi:spore germination protein [Bacillus sp. 179-C3.3 HS]|uniref:spore germination protein n=1 Tax=Bacillus sp. 179-C3.3 HS TaxID=3232162 RepID=UPI0039A00616
MKSRIEQDVEIVIKRVKSFVGKSDDIVFHSFSFGPSAISSCLVYVEGLTEFEMLSKQIISPLQKELDINEVQHTTLSALSQQFFGIQNDVLEDMNLAIEQLYKGKAILFVDGASQALAFQTNLFQFREVEEPQSEVLVRGPRIGFIENLEKNTALLRERANDPNLVIQKLNVGARNHKFAALVYVRDIADPTLVEDVVSRVKQIRMDDIPETGYIEQLIEDSHLSIFPQIQNTERPDRVIAAVLEGKVAIMLDGTPFALILPMTITALMQSPEDYYQRWTSATLLRLLRYISVLLTVFLPGLYIALVSYHPGLLPTQMALTIAGSRQNVPFPPVVEAILMSFTIELLREAGLRLPRAIGQTIGLIGGVIIGQAAVQANIVSALMVIIVSLTALADFTAPSYDFSFPLRILRFMAIFSSAMFGLYGLIMCYLFVLCHLMQLKSFGFDYFTPVLSAPYSDLKDMYVRLPVGLLKTRPKTARTANIKRQGE